MTPFDVRIVGGGGQDLLEWIKSIGPLIVSLIVVWRGNAASRRLSQDAWDKQEASAKRDRLDAKQRWEDELKATAESETQRWKLEKRYSLYVDLLTEADSTTKKLISHLHDIVTYSDRDVRSGLPDLEGELDEARRRTLYATFFAQVGSQIAAASNEYQVWRDRAVVIGSPEVSEAANEVGLVCYKIAGELIDSLSADGSCDIEAVQAMAQAVLDDDIWAPFNRLRSAVSGDLA